MTTYVSLLSFTEQGIRNLKQSAARARAFRDAAQQTGVKVIGQYWTAGDYDGVLILQGENENAVLRCLTDLAATGNVRPCSLRAFDATEFAALTGG